MIWQSEYAPVSYFRRVLPTRQSAFDEFNGELSDPLVNAVGLCFRFRFAVRASCARGGLERFTDFRERRVCVVCRGRWRWKIEVAGCFGHELGHADGVQVKVVKQPAFVFNRSDGKFEPLCYKSSNNFQRSVTSLEAVSLHQSVGSLDTVSTTRGSGWVRSRAPSCLRAAHPPATAGGTDCLPTISWS